MSRSNMSAVTCGERHQMSRKRGKERVRTASFDERLPARISSPRPESGCTHQPPPIVVSCRVVGRESVKP